MPSAGQRRLRIPVSAEVTLPRSCSGCGHSWERQVTVRCSRIISYSGDAPSQEDREKGRAKAMKGLEKAKARRNKKGDPDQGVLCPECRRFASGAVSKHFPKGYAAALQRKSRVSLFGNLFMIVLMGSWVLFVLRSFMGFFAGREGALMALFREFDDTKFGDLGAYIIVLWVGAMFSSVPAYFVVSEIRGMPALLAERKRGMEMIRGSSEAELHALAVRVYEENKDSLGVQTAKWIKAINAAADRYFEKNGRTG